MKKTIFLFSFISMIFSQSFLAAEQSSAETFVISSDKEIILINDEEADICIETENSSALSIEEQLELLIEDLKASDSEEEKETLREKFFGSNLEYFKDKAADKIAALEETLKDCGEKLQAELNKAEKSKGVRKIKRQMKKLQKKIEKLKEFVFSSNE